MSMNPTRELLVDVFAELGVLTCFGPGYQPLQIVSRGIEAFIEANGPFDVVIADEYSIQDFSKLGRGEPLRFVIHACRFDRNLLRIGLDYKHFLERYRGLRLLTLMQSDYYNFPPERIDAMEGIADFFVTWGEELILPREAFADTATLPGGVNASIVAHSNDNYLDFLKRNRHRVISCPHFVHPTEGSDIPLTKRPIAWSVLGADYDARIVVRDLVDGQGIPRSGDWLRHAHTILTRLGVNVYAHYWSIGLMRKCFQKALRRSKHSFTCGSVLRWPIRKYFELPANGCTLVCEKTTGFSALGFRSGVNACACDARDILDANAWLEANIGEAQALADAGRSHVLKTHSVPARANQIAKALASIFQGSFKGSYWHRGRFELAD